MFLPESTSLRGISSLEISSIDFTISDYSLKFMLLCGSNCILFSIFFNCILFSTFFQDEKTFDRVTGTKEE